MHCLLQPFAALSDLFASNIECAGMPKGSNRGCVGKPKGSNRECVGKSKGSSRAKRQQARA